MKRDMDLIRFILLELEQSETWGHPGEMEFPNYSDKQVNFHQLLAIEAGLADGDIFEEYGADPHVMINRLTWKGHEFLDASRESSRWEKAKGIADKAGGLTLDAMLEVLKKLAAQQFQNLITGN